MEVVEADDGSMSFVGAKRFEQSEQVVDRFVLKFQNAEFELGSDKVSASSVELNRPGTTPNVSGSQFGRRNAEEKFTSKGLGEKFKLAHFVGTENARLSLASKLFEKLPTEGSFTGSGRCADDVKTGTEKLELVEIDEARATVGVVFHLFNFGIKLVGEEVAEGKFLRGNGRAADLVEGQLSFSDDVGRGKLS